MNDDENKLFDDGPDFDEETQKKIDDAIDHAIEHKKLMKEGNPDEVICDNCGKGVEEYGSCDECGAQWCGGCDKFTTNFMDDDFGDPNARCNECHIDEAEAKRDDFPCPY